MLANLIFASVLVALGVASYLGTARVSVTALIPAFFGVLVALFTLLGWLVPSLGTAMRHTTTGLAVLGFLATARSLPSIRHWGRSPGGPSPATLAKSVMSVLCLAFVGFAILSA
jgi:hypothetical protein